MELFKELHDYGKYLKDNPFHQNLGMVNAEEYGDLEKKNISSEGSPSLLSPPGCRHAVRISRSTAGAMRGRLQASRATKVRRVGAWCTAGARRPRCWWRASPGPRRCRTMTGAHIGRS